MTNDPSRNPVRPSKNAIALEYDPGKHRAPVISASGKGVIAERIIEIAKQHDIPVTEDPDLVHLLSKLDLDEAIPPELYPVVAEVFAFVHFLALKKRGLDTSSAYPAQHERSSLNGRAGGVKIDDTDVTS